MRPDRRTTVAGAALVSLVALIALDPVGVRGALGAWLQVADPASGPPGALASAIADRAATVDALEAALAADPVLSLALLATGLGLGSIVGSAVAYLHQRKRIQRGDRDA